MKTYLPTRRSRARAISILLVSALFFVAAQFLHTTHAARPFTVSAVPAVADVTQIVVRLPDSVIGAPRDLLVKVTLHGSSTNEAFIKIGAPI